jgi:hypothetical protein
LRQLAVEAADGALHFPEVSKFFTERHIAICDYYIADCDWCQEENERCFFGPFAMIEAAQNSRIEALP